MNLKDMFGDIDEKRLEIQKKIAKVSRALMEERYNKNLNQTKFGELLGVSQPMISKIESFDYNPTIKKLFEISEKLDLDVDISFKPKYHKIHYTSVSKFNLDENITLKWFKDMPELQNYGSLKIELKNFIDSQSKNEGIPMKILEIDKREIEPILESPNLCNIA